MFAFANHRRPKKLAPGKQNPGKPPSGGPWRQLRNPIGRGSFFGNLILTFFIFLFLMSGYSLVADFFTETPEIPLSTVAADVGAEKVRRIRVNGDLL